MLTFQDQALADKVRAWRDANYQSAGWLKGIQRRLYLLAVYIAFNEKIYGLTWWLQEKTSLLNRFTKAYHLDEKIHFPPDYLDQMLEVEAAVGLKQLERYDDIISRRQSNAISYDEQLKRREGWVFPPIRKGATYSHYVVRVPERKPVIDEWAAKGVHLGELIQYSIPLLPEYSKRKMGACQRAEKASLSTVNLPLSTSAKKIKDF
jgi:perosamine synthetase